MFKKIIIPLTYLIIIVFASAAFKKESLETNYAKTYFTGLAEFSDKQKTLLNNISKTDFTSSAERNKIKEQINLVRTSLKQMDFWFRYLEPTSYKKINGPLPVEWETEVFEKFEKPYRRQGAEIGRAHV